MAKKGPTDDNNTPGTARTKAPRPRTRRSRSEDLANTAPTSPVEAAPAIETVVETYEGREYSLHEIADDRSMSGAPGDALPVEPSEDDIRYRAYQRYVARGGQHGADFDDWLQAEQELRRR
jgi:hypothetical protein